MSGCGDSFSRWNSLQQPRSRLTPPDTSTLWQSASFFAPNNSMYPAASAERRVILRTTFVRVLLLCGWRHAVQYLTLVRYRLLTLWKDADPDIPILKQAKAEYAKLQ
jgi:hypothetical protein